MGRLLPAMTQQKLDTQRDVVKNERRWSVDNQPYGTWWEKLPALAFPPDHPFHHSLIGSMEDLSEASLDDVAQFFATYYTPDNAVLSIAGDFDPSEARRLVEQYFGPIPRGANRPPLPPMELPPTFGEWRREVVIDAVMLPRLYLAFRSPVFGSDEYYAASVTGAILGMRRGSRLHRALVRERQDRLGRHRVHVRSAERERPARRRCHRASGNRRRGSGARSRAGDRHAASRLASTRPKSSARLRSSKPISSRRCRPLANVLTSCRCSRRISAIRGC